MMPWIGSNAMNVLAAAIILMLIGGALPSLSRRRPLAGEAAFRIVFGAACGLGAVPAIASLAGASHADVHLRAAVPGGPWVFGVDALSALFLLAIFLAGGTSAIYGITYLGPERGRRGVAAAHFLTALMVAALVLVVTARAAVPFLIGWEVMAVAAFLLIVFEHERPEVRRAGLVYLGATHAGTLALFALFAAWGDGAADLTFASLAAQAPDLPAGGAVILVLGLFGFGMKAGMVPLHFWLPEAHAAAPSHVSALMSGVVIKMGIYGLFRTVVLMGSPPAWYGWVLVAIGALSGILGVVWALAQHDLKRLLAFHSVENIGIILLGLGAGTLGVAYGESVVAVLGFAGAALHTLNHALFKSLLFLGAGSVVHGAGTREMDRLGGLAVRMPRTAAAFLVGAAAIVGLPPLNGFVSEWLVFLSLVQTGGTALPLRLAVIASAALGLIGALALACFAKVFGIVFLGLPRTAQAGAARESSRGMVVPLFVLAAACILIGLLPIVAVRAAVRVAAIAAGSGNTGAVDYGMAAASPMTAFALALAGALILAWLLRRRVWPLRDAAATVTWGCAYPAPTPRMQYTSSSFAAPLLSSWSAVSSVRTHRTHGALSTHPIEPVLEGVLRPMLRFVISGAALLRPLQRGRLTQYLLYIGLAVLSLLLYLLAAGDAT
jgi:hydrogenase-4 component B